MDETTMTNTELTDVTEVKPYTLKKLCAENIFTLTSILKNIGFNELKNVINAEDIQTLAKTATDSASVEKVGLQIFLDVATVVIGNLEACKDSIYKLLSDLSGIKIEEIAALDMDVFISMIFDVFKKEEFKDFIKVVSKFLK